MLELPEAVRGDIEGWLERELEGPEIATGKGVDLGVVLATTVRRDRRALAPLIGAVKACPAAAVGVGLGPALAALPSSRRPRLFLLPARVFGRGAGLTGLADLIDRIAAGGSPLGRGMPRRFHIVAGRARVGREAGEEPPRPAPGHLPAALRGPFDAVRLGLYCSTTTSEGLEPVPLARVELPQTAAVR